MNTITMSVANGMWRKYIMAFHDGESRDVLSVYLANCVGVVQGALRRLWPTSF
jgi:hypothetical protein